MKRLNENDVVRLTAEYIISKGGKVISFCTTQQKGHDLVVEMSNGDKLIIEAKGDTSSNPNSKRYKVGFSKNQIWSHGAVALMKTLVVMNASKDVNEKFGIAVPISHKEMISWIKPSLDKLGILVFLVSSEEVYQF